MEAYHGAQHDEYHVSPMTHSTSMTVCLDWSVEQDLFVRKVSKSRLQGL